ncbi:Misato segment II tubulin-like domain-containing protein [Lentinula aff. lateritia]|uniref:Misato segment II tubulin-like domain-containing protein n=1 Tax=Lentinula aff. lateritia TaxID=2804960 RepID=A0ACC1TPA3_9AGAR|nr:Misato segment II tubulin-like domain-containing protein [Lentinula aff. lateritia]
MREILYVQAGNLANYIGTHFWNAQESYFAYSGHEETLFNHDVSFREGETPQGDPTYCPRLISFDRKASFGALSKTNTLYENDDIENSQLWWGEIAEYEHVPIEPHAYQTHLLQSDREPTFSALNSVHGIRYWSDFNRVFYIPRTIQMLPDVPDWQQSEGDWALGQESFQRYNEETELMESSVRLFIEECNSFQGLQLMNDTSTFGSFSSSFLMAFNDEFSTAPCLSFPLMGDAVPRNVNAVLTRKIVNDAVYLRELDSLSLLTVPILNPKTWSQGYGDVNLRISDDHYHTSSILSAHIESSTLPLRLKVNHEDISSISENLNFHGTHRFSQLAGIFPVASGATPQDFVRQSFNFSILRNSSMATVNFARRDVTRGFSASNLQAYNSWYSQEVIKGPFVSSTHAQAYPLPSSFPDIFRNEGILTNHRQTLHMERNLVLPSASLFTTLSANSRTAEMFADYAKVAQTCVDRRKIGILPGLVDSLDDIKELVNDLWTIHDGYLERSVDESDSDNS